MTNYISKNDQLFFDTLEKASAGDLRSQTDVRIAIQAFLAEPKAVKQKKIQGFGVSTDLAELTKDAFNVTIQQDNFDLGWEQAFRQVVLGEKQDSWEIYDVGNSLTFMKVEEGQRIEVAGITGTKATAYVDYYGGALGWTDKMIRFRKVSSMIDMALIFRNKFWSNKANNHYALLSASALLNVTAYQAGTGQLQRDIATINLAMATLGDRCKDKGYGDTATAPIVMYASPYDEARIEAAFNATTNAMAMMGIVGTQIASRRVTRIYTFNANVSRGLPIIVLPGNKIQKADALPPTTFTAPKDILTLNEMQSVWAIYGGIIGDTDQTQTITLA